MDYIQPITVEIHLLVLTQPQLEAVVVQPETVVPDPEDRAGAAELIIAVTVEVREHRVKATTVALLRLGVGAAVAVVALVKWDKTDLTAKYTVMVVRVRCQI